MGLLEEYQNDLQKISDSIKGTPTYEQLLALYSMASYMLEDLPSEKDTVFQTTNYVKYYCDKNWQYQDDNDKMWQLLYQVYLFEAPHKLDSFLRYMEKKRPFSEKFYEPRITPLKQIVDGIQALVDDELDELFVNAPPRIGKTQIMKMAQLWCGSRKPESTNLYCAFSDKITRAYYSGLLELMTDPIYTYSTIFPQTKLFTNGEDETIDLRRNRSYKTFTARSIYGTLNGSCDCDGIAIADDLFSGIEEALSVDRQETVWSKFDNNFIPRLKKTAKLINMGTRWAVGDCQGRRLNLLEHNEQYKDKRWRAIILPALNENGESNFNYPCDGGFTTKKYLERRASFEANDDMASWFAQYQQEPIERKGTLFNTDNLKFFNPETDLPNRKPDRVIMAVDIAFGGGDFVAAPIGLEYDGTVYVISAIFDKGDKFVTRPRIVQAVMDYGVNAIRFEETKTTAEYREWCEGQWKEFDYSVNSYGAAPPSDISKNARIFDKAPEIREMYFLDIDHRNQEYNAFMRNVYCFVIEGRVKHDDAPDSLAMLCECKIRNNMRKKAHIYRNMW